MPNPILTAEQRAKLFQPLFTSVLQKLTELSGGDPNLLFALRRKLAKELQYQERGTPRHRGLLKTIKREEQHGHCAICRKLLPEKDTILDRIHAPDGYTAANTRLICRTCDYDAQAAKNFA
jgi:hypothetical protein